MIDKKLITFYLGYAVYYAAYSVTGISINLLTLGRMSVHGLNYMIFTIDLHMMILEGTHDKECEPVIELCEVAWDRMTEFDKSVAQKFSKAIGLTVICIQELREEERNGNA